MFLLSAYSMSLVSRDLGRTWPVGVLGVAGCLSMMTHGMEQTGSVLDDDELGIVLDHAFQLIEVG